MPKTPKNVLPLFQIDGIPRIIAKQSNCDASGFMCACLCVGVCVYACMRVCMHVCMRDSDLTVCMNVQIKGPDYSPIAIIAKRLRMQCQARIKAYELAHNLKRSKQQAKVVTEKGRKNNARRKIYARNSGSTRRTLAKLTKKSLGFSDDFSLGHSSKDGQVRSGEG